MSLLFLLTLANPWLDLQAPLNTPEIGDHALHVVAPHLLELELTNTQEVPPIEGIVTTPTVWDFLDRSARKANAPTVASFEVNADGTVIDVIGIGFTRRSAHASVRETDFRVGNSIYLLLDDPISDGATVSVTDRPEDAHDYLFGMGFTTTTHPDRVSSAIHVNQVGFVPTYDNGLPGVKKGYASLFLGDLGIARVDSGTGAWVVDIIDDGALGTFTGERHPLGVNIADGYEIVTTDTGAVVFPGGGETATWNVRGDSRWPAYDGVLEADFSSVVAPGYYRLRVPGMGASLPFRIGNGVGATFARTFALGFYHQRSAQDHAAPFTRYIDGPAHLAPATTPVDDGQDEATYDFVTEYANTFVVNQGEERHPAMQARSPETLLYPFVGDIAAWWPMDGKQVILAGDLVDGFDSYDGSVITDPYAGDPNGHAFGSAPSRGATVGIKATATVPEFIGQESWVADGVAFDGLTGLRGVGFANSYHLPDGWQTIAPVNPARATGHLQTKSFTIDQPYVALLIGGSDKPYDLMGAPGQTDVTAVNLVVGGVPVATATGANSNTMTWHHWDASAYQGQLAHVEIIDSSTTGFILADELIQTSQDHLRDVSANRSHARRFGGSELGAGQLGSSLAFDGIDDHVVADALPDLDAESTFTMSFWMQLLDLTRDQTVLAKGSELIVRYQAASQSLRVDVGGAFIEGTAIPIADLNWHFITLRFEANSIGGLELFVDHQQAASPVSTAGITNFPNTGSLLYMGNASSLTSSSFFHGKLDDLRIRTSHVSAEELLETSAGAGPWIDVSGGHFDAGDYSKYMKNSGLTVHILTFTVDQILQIDGSGPGADLFDNLGLPESGDGICDLLQEAKWEADFIAKMQDSDGGFFTMVNPRYRRFESDALPSEGGRQVVWPKSLIATGVAVGSLAELGNSPAFKAHYPGVAAEYRAKALLGWQFIENAVATYGIDGGHQQIYHYGANFLARDELAYAAAAMFAMTGEPGYESRLLEWMPYDTTPELHNNVSGWRPFRRFTWQRLYESVGAAMRVYAFAQRGALSGNTITYAPSLILGKSYFEHVTDEIKGAGDDAVMRAEQSPYGVSVPIESKAFGAVGYIFPESEAFDLITASLLDPQPAYWNGILSNVDYQAGGNPVNTSFISGLGWVQPRNFVSQWALNDPHQLPPIGLTSGSVNSGLPFLLNYGSLLGGISYPPDVHENDYALPYGTYHRYADAWHVGNELVILDLARSMATTSYLMSQVPNAGSEPWTAPPSVTITGVPADPLIGTPAMLSLETSGDLTEARVLWESKGGRLSIGVDHSFSPTAPGETWVEAEVLWPNGQRSFARDTFSVREPVTTQYSENYQPAVPHFAEGPYRKILGNDHVRVYYPLDGNVSPVSGPLLVSAPAFPNLTLFGGASLELGYFTFPGYEHRRPNFAAMGFHGATDRMEVTFTSPSTLFPADADWFSLEAMIYVESHEEGIADSELLRFETAGEPRLSVTRSRWQGPTAFWTGYEGEVDIEASVPENAWIHLRLVQDATTAYAFVNGNLVHSEPTTTLGSWLAPDATILFSAGQFNGWIANIAIKAGQGALEVADTELEIVLGAPVVELGAFAQIDVLDTYSPNAVVIDDDSNSSLSFHWTGSEGVTIDDPIALNPAIGFPGIGDHWLELEVLDSTGKIGRDEVLVRVSNISGNTSPSVELGPPTSIALPATWAPSPTIADDGHPLNALTYAWSQLSGPAPATISDPSLETPTVGFSVEGVYTFELQVSDSLAIGFDRISIVVDFPAGSLVLGDPFVTDADTLLLYHFDNDLTDSSGNLYNLTAGGSAAFSTDTNWMVTPAGASASFAALGDQLTVTLPDSLIMPDPVSPNTTTALTMEWRYHAKEDLAYSLQSALIVSLEQSYDTLLNLEQNKWAMPTNGAVHFGQEEIGADFLELFLPKNEWLEMKMTYIDDISDSEDGEAQLFVNHQLVATIAVTLNYGRVTDWILTLGNVDGYVDELRVSRIVRPEPVINEAPLLAIDPWNHVFGPKTVAMTPPAVIDDGLPGTGMTYLWEIVSGEAANVSFDNATLPAPQVTLLAAGSYTLRLTVSDGEFTTSALSEWLVEPNTPPVLDPIGPLATDEWVPLSFTATASDADSDTLTFTLGGIIPTGATITSDGAFSWTPTDAQSPATYTFDVVVTDDGIGLFTDRETISVTVHEINVAPVLNPVGDQVIAEQAPLAFTATSADVDVPANSLTFSLSGGAPAGAVISSSGAFTWTPSESLGGSSFTFDIIVTDDGPGNLSDSETITVTVQDANSAPMLDIIGDRTVAEFASLNFTASAVDSDDPVNALTFSLDGSVPPGASITPGGAFSWAPTAAQVPGAYTFDVVVTDDGVGNLADSETITVLVHHENTPPTLGAIGDQVIDELTTLTFTATATDSDDPADTLTFSLLGTVPSGATITPGGSFSWTPTEAQGPSSFTFGIIVTDDGHGTLTDSETITVTVNETNVPPTLTAIGPQSVDELTELSFTVSAADSDEPVNNLNFSLGATAPAGASLSAGGTFRWTPTEAQSPGTYSFDVVVTDDGIGTLSDSETITVTVVGTPFENWINVFYPGEADPNIVGMAADPNVDGWSNALAFVLAMDPREHHPDMLPKQSADSTYSITEYARSDRAAFLAPFIEYSTDMSTWDEAIHGQDGVIIEVVDDGFGTDFEGIGIDKVTVKIPHLGANVFSRLAMETTP